MSIFKKGIWTSCRSNTSFPNELALLGHLPSTVLHLAPDPVNTYTHKEVYFTGAICVSAAIDYGWSSA